MTVVEGEPASADPTDWLLVLGAWIGAGVCWGLGLGAAFGGILAAALLDNLGAVEIGAPMGALLGAPVGLVTGASDGLVLAVAARTALLAPSARNRRARATATAAVTTAAIAIPAFGLVLRSLHWKAGGGWVIVLPPGAVAVALSVWLARRLPPG